MLRVCVGQLHLLRDACAEMAELRSQDGRSRPDDFLSEEFGSDEGELVEGVAGVCLDGSVPEGTAEALPGETGAWTEEERRLVKPCMRLIEAGGAAPTCAPPLTSCQRGKGGAWPVPHPSLPVSE